MLEVDCICNTTNERLNEDNSVSYNIINRAGKELLDELKAYKGEFRIFLLIFVCSECDSTQIIIRKSSASIHQTQFPPIFH